MFYVLWDINNSILNTKNPISFSPLHTAQPQSQSSLGGQSYVTEFSPAEKRIDIMCTASRSGSLKLTPHAPQYSLTFLWQVLKMIDQQDGTTLGIRITFEKPHMDHEH